ncbi:hypothetical protein NP233_g4310 [Leucocoprinus birnbaumii]|uniref:F-box domain-containing protein n=1 Tax=Leucocoprinus birnbaumii TaxID=56174 RepID=A0AAD5VUY5_9AGAR|nr:hypothetical protein NP233_g4310 [Leucocoprinus birnbaumii]
MVLTTTGLNLLSLPNDVLLEILGLLTALEVTDCGLVCRRLYNLSSNRNVWLRILGAGNYGYIAALSSTVKRSDETSELRRLLIRAEHTERSWGGFDKSEVKESSLWQADHSSINIPCAFVQNCLVFHNTLDWSWSSQDLIYTWYPVERLSNQAIESVFTYTLRRIHPKEPNLEKRFFKEGMRVISDALHIVYGKILKDNRDELISLHLSKVERSDEGFTVSHYLTVEVRVNVHDSGELRWLDEEHFILVAQKMYSRPGEILLFKRTTGEHVSINSQHPTSTNGSNWQTNHGLYRLSYSSTPSYLVHVINGQDYEIFKLPNEIIDNHSTSTKRETSSRPLKPFQAGEIPFQLNKICHVQEHSPSELTIVGFQMHSWLHWQLAIIHLKLNLPRESSSSLLPATIEKLQLSLNINEEPRMQLISANPRHPCSHSIMIMYSLSNANTYYAVRVNFAPDTRRGQEVELTPLELSRAKRTPRQFFWMDRSSHDAGLLVEQYRRPIIGRESLESFQVDDGRRPRGSSNSSCFDVQLTSTDSSMSITTLISPTELELSFPAANILPEELGSHTALGGTCCGLIIRQL